MVVQNAKVDSIIFSINSKAFRYPKRNLEGRERRNGLSKNTLLDDHSPHTTPSPLLWRALNLVRREFNQGRQNQTHKETHKQNFHGIVP